MNALVAKDPEFYPACNALVDKHRNDLFRREQNLSDRLTKERQEHEAHREYIRKLFVSFSAGVFVTAMVMALFISWTVWMG